MEDRYDSDKSDIEEVIDVVHPFADFLSNEYVSQNVRHEKSPQLSRRSKAKPKRASKSSTQLQSSNRKRSSSSSIAQEVAVIM